MWPAIHESNALIIDDDTRINNNEYSVNDIEYRLQSTTVPLHMVYMSKDVGIETMIKCLEMILKHPVHVASIKFIICKHQCEDPMSYRADNAKLHEYFAQFPHGAKNIESFLGC